MQYDPSLFLFILEAMRKYPEPTVPPLPFPQEEDAAFWNMSDAELNDKGVQAALFKSGIEKTWLAGWPESQSTLDWYCNLLLDAGLIVEWDKSIILSRGMVSVMPARLTYQGVQWLEAVDEAGGPNEFLRLVRDKLVQEGVTLAVQLGKLAFGAG